MYMTLCINFQAHMYIIKKLFVQINIVVVNNLIRFYIWFLIKHINYVFIYLHVYIFYIYYIFFILV